MAFLHLDLSLASAIFSCFLRRSALTTSFHLNFGLPWGVGPSTSKFMIFFVYDVSSCQCILIRSDLIFWTSYLEFGAGNISPRSFTFGHAFHRPPKPPFFWFARITTRAWAIGRTLCQDLEHLKLDALLSNRAVFLLGIFLFKESPKKTRTFILTSMMRGNSIIAFHHVFIITFNVVTLQKLFLTDKT